MKLENLSTPSLIVDERIFNENIQSMKELLKGSNLKLRPHYKSHKCAEIAHRQIVDGAVGITCAKLDEAIDLVDSGIENVLIANQIADKSKIAKMAYLAKACRLTVCVDNKDNIYDIENACSLAGSTVHVLIEYEIGMKRCGVLEKEAVADLVDVIKNCKHLVFDGIQAYAGHISHMISLEERCRETEKNSLKIKELLSYLESRDIKVNILSGGSSGTSMIKAQEGLYNELQAGSYLFMDSTYADLQLPFKNSLFIMSTVVSVNKNLVVIDAGVKSCGVDQGLPKVVGIDVSEIVASEEHFQLHNPSKELKVGDKVFLIPGHCCSTVNLHDKIYFVNDGKVVRRCLITARGCCH